MTDLTEKFKKHELPKGFYYAQMSNGSVEILSDYALYRYALAKDGNKIKILLSVPTYEEFNKIKETLAEHKEYCCCLKNEVLRLKLAEMEELLRECQAHLSLGEIGTSVTPINVLLTRINAALGER